MEFSRRRRFDSACVDKGEIWIGGGTSGRATAMRDSRRKRLRYAVVCGGPDIERIVGLDNGDPFIMLWIGYAEQPSASDASADQLPKRQWKRMTVGLG